MSKGGGSAPGEGGGPARPARRRDASTTPSDSPRRSAAGRASHGARAPGRASGGRGTACGGVAGLEVHDAYMPAAMAFFGFAIGYAGLAWLYWPFQ